MKKLSFALLVIASFSIIAWQEVKERVFTVHFKESTLNKHWSKLNTIQALVDQSNLPHDQVKFINLSLDSLKMDIAADVQKQLADTL